jgi:outer membrane protein OmpA-like peptidoglycan-associated protein
VTAQEIVIDLSSDVLFDFDQSELGRRRERLGHLLTVVHSRPGAQISIAGHTDVRGDDAYNQALSERRAGSVRSWLTAHGVEGSHITATGAGESRPLRAGHAEEDHQANRRVEIRIRN